MGNFVAVVLAAAAMGVLACAGESGDTSEEVVAAQAEDMSWGAVAGWPRLPVGVELGETVGVAVDSHNHVFVFHRVDRAFDDPLSDEPIQGPPILMFDGETGELLSRWGEQQFFMPHGLEVGPDDTVWVTDIGTHQLHEISHDGNLLRSWGEPGVAGSDSGHFGRPTDMAFDRNGRLFVSDGYDNGRVVRFSASGQFELEWGSLGREPGQMRLPHGIAVGETGRVFVADRANSRMQVFDADGELEAVWKRKKIGRPYGVAIGLEGNLFLVEGGDQPDGTRSRVLVMSQDGRIRESFDAAFPGDPAPLGHDIAVGADGAVYVADVWARRVQKFTRSRQIDPRAPDPAR